VTPRPLAFLAAALIGEAVSVAAQSPRSSPSPLGMPLQQSRYAVIAPIAGAKAPLGDSAFLHLRGPEPR
jgi:hypothetical protein